MIAQRWNFKPEKNEDYLSAPETLLQGASCSLQTDIWMLGCLVSSRAMTYFICGSPFGVLYTAFEWNLILIKLYSRRHSISSLETLSSIQTGRLPNESPQCVPLSKMMSQKNGSATIKWKIIMLSIMGMLLQLKRVFRRHSTRTKWLQLRRSSKAAFAWIPRNGLRRVNVWGMNGYLWPMLAHAHSVEASDHDTSNDCWMYISTITKDVRLPWIYMFNHHQSFLTQPRRRCRSFECAQVNVMLQAVQCASESPTKYVHALMAALAWDLSSRIFPFGMYISRFSKIYRTFHLAAPCVGSSETWPELLAKLH